MTHVTRSPSWRRVLRTAGTLLAAAVLGGCAALNPLVPQTVQLRTEWPQGVPQQVELAQVPFHAQDDYQCGPASLAMALQWAGVQPSLPQLIEQVWLPSRKGSLQLEMLATPRRYGRVSYRLSPSYADLLREVAAGNPVIVLQDVGTMFTQWHYAVVNGFDYASGTVYLRSGTDPRQEMPFSYFERTWMKGGYWAMVVMPPDKVAATATPERWLEAVIAMSRVGDAAGATRAYDAMLARWPDNLAASIGLANQLHGAGKLEDAAVVLRRALARDPRSVILRNNLAQTLSDLGQHFEALKVLEPVSTDATAPFAAEIKATRQLILGRLQARASS
ncbi:PA2778 family cysteine peptidase [Ramlibacter albus]|uniref:PA2778 family cysteine peptidase n=1 Tax=Ramlibacter albus TaxID=2079448 RepID=A0A923S4D6_9BURK|nr:PA2778 family cysteine peptidase [Ramlibacter albus]MBC5767390.1 PA2778 family cysteine peptidase [Ramlibacter albus]